MLKNTMKKIAQVAVAAALLPAVSAAIEIASFADLNNIRNNLGGSYELVSDIAIPPGTNFVPIGTREKPFTGKFHGKKGGEAGRVAVISGLGINRGGADSLTTGWAAGLFGVIGAGGEVKYVGVAADAVVGYYAAGVLAGINKGVIEGCHSIGNLVAARRAGESNAGGLAGVNSGTISRSFSMANALNEGGGANAGGLVGFLTEAAGKPGASGLVSDCYATGVVSGAAAAGGLVGYVFGGKITNSYSVGAVESAGAAGGLVGADFAGTASWNTQGKNPGGHVAMAVVESSYWDRQASGQDTSAGGAGKSTFQMTSSATYAGWNFGQNWEMAPGSYPRLKGIVVEEETKQEAIVYLAGAGGGVMAGDSARALASLRFEGIGDGESGPLVAAVPENGYRFDGWDDGNKSMARRDRGAADTVITFTARFTPVAAATSFIRIANLEDLRKIGTVSSHPLSGNYTQTANIDGGGAVFAPIGASGNPFRGIFRGNGNRISGLRIAGGDFAGLFGHTDGAVITGVALEGVEADGKNSVGTLVGKGVNTYIDGCGTVGGAAKSDYGNGVGGLAGNISGSVAIRCYSLSSASGATAGAGGLIGVSVNSMVTHSYSTWNAEARESAGGLVGHSDGGSVRFCYSTGNVEGGSGVGGLTGKVSNGGEVHRSYSSGRVTGGAGVGGFAGIVESGGVVSACYWNTETSRRNSSAGGSGAAGKSTQEMMTRQTFAGWDFTAVWEISAGNSYPYLRGTSPYRGYLPGPQLRTR